VSDIPHSVATPTWVETNGSKALGRVIRDLRVRAGWSQAALADRAGVSRNHVGLIERGAIASPRLTVVCQLAQALDVSAGVLALSFLGPPDPDGLRDTLAARSAPQGPRPAAYVPASAGAAVRLGLMVRDLRGRARIGQDRLAILAGLSRSTVNKFERGMTSDPELMTLVRVAYALTRNVEDPRAVERAGMQLVSAFAGEPQPAP
jgi:transcriptional regulator with XRE-family HTH domain